MAEISRKLRAAVVGLRMGAYHAEAYATLPEYELAALCDLSQPLLEQVAAGTGCCALYEDYDRMLKEARPDVVCVTTPNNLHETMTLKAVAAGVRGVYCEKPIAMGLGAARRMGQACGNAGIPLVIGHQRRVSAPYRKMREIIASGELGDVTLMRGSCPGDMLSDGTHTMDSLLFLNGGCAVSWVLAQVYRGRKATAEELAVNPWLYCGTRYGHNVEEGAIATVQFANGVRAEIMTGTMWQPSLGYQNMDVFGSKGRLLRAGDGADPAVAINTGGRWLAVPVADDDDGGLKEAHRLFARTVLDGAAHPMGISEALPGFEAVMAVYESARLNGRVELPLGQEDFPLDLMLREGRIS